MVDRCTKPSNKKYKDYGGRGIKICDRWLNGAAGKHGAVCFVDDMGTKPSPTHTIDREDNNGDYEPSNCSWSTPVEQANNRRNTRYLTHDGVTQTLSEWSEQTGLSRALISSRIHACRWPVWLALTLPKMENEMPRKPKRRRIPLSRSQKYATLICQLVRQDGSPLLDREWAKTRTALEIIAEFEKIVEWDHVVPVAVDGAHHPTNFQPLLKVDHKAKTRIDVARIWKGKRLRHAVLATKTKMAEKVGRPGAANLLAADAARMIDDRYHRMTEIGSADAEQVALQLAAQQTDTQDADAPATQQAIGRVQNGKRVAKSRWAKRKVKIQSRGFQGSRSFAGEIRWRKDKRS